MEAERGAELISHDMLRAGAHTWSKMAGVVFLGRAWEVAAWQLCRAATLPFLNPTIPTRGGVYGRAAMRVPHLVEDGGGDGERAAGIWHIHNARHSALAGAARQQQVDLQCEGNQGLSAYGI